jgi:hypothetical protein
VGEFRGRSTALHDCAESCGSNSFCMQEECSQEGGTEMKSIRGFMVC